MANIVHHLGINVVPSRLYEALTTKKGLASWLVAGINKSTYQEGDLVTFQFSEGCYSLMNIQKLVPNKLVEWKCVDQNFSKRNGWNNTFMRFEIMQSQDNNTLLTFSHMGWKEENAFYKYCLKRWSYFLGVSLHRFLENGDIEIDPYSFQRVPNSQKKILVS